MKRSLMNQLTSHLMLGMLLNNNLVTPFFTWRLLIGPLHSSIATFVAYKRTEHNVNTFQLKIKSIDKMLTVLNASLPIWLSYSQWATQLC